VEVATTKGKIESLSIIPDNPPATKEALAAIEDAEWVTFGPGSWFSSVMPHLLLQEQAQALAATTARRVMIFNLPEPAANDEFAGSSPEEHLSFVLRHMPDLRLDYAIADTSAIALDSQLKAMVEGLGGELVVADLAEAPGSVHHSVEKLRSVFAHIMGVTLLR